jgi:hypothetical protein
MIPSKGEKFTLAYSFRGVSLLSLDYNISGFVMRRNIMMRSVWWKKRCLPRGVQEAGGAGDEIYISRAHSTSTTRQYPLKFPPPPHSLINYEWIHPLMDEFRTM